MTTVLSRPPAPAAAPRRPLWRRVGVGLRAGLRGIPGGLRVALVLGVLAGIGSGLLGGQAFPARALGLSGVSRRPADCR